MIQYSQAPIVNTTFQLTAGTRVEMVEKISAALQLAGFTLISGGGTDDQLLGSGQTPQGISFQLRLYDPGAGNCIQVFMKNAVGTITQSQPGYMLPTLGKTYRVIASPFQFFCFSSAPSVAREFIAGGAPHIPSFLQITDCLWFHAAARGDADATVVPSFRTRLGLAGSSGPEQGGTSFHLVNSTSWTSTPGINTNYVRGGQRLVIPTFCSYEVNNALAWHDGSLIIADPLISWGLTAATDPAAIKAQLWDAAVVTDALTGDSLLNFDNRNWFAVTDNNTGTGGTVVRGSLVVMVP